MNIYRRTLLYRLLMVVLLMFLVSCASMKDRWDNLTPQEQAQIVLNGLQDQLNLWFDAGKSFVATDPIKYKQEWKTKIVPLFDVANQAIKDAVVYKKSPGQVYSEVSPTVEKAVTALRSWGVVTQ